MYKKVDEADIAFLRELLGERYVSRDEVDLVTNANDAYVSGFSLPEVVVWPGSTDEVSAILRYATTNRIPVTVRAAGTSLVGSCVPQHGGIVMNVMRMNKVISVNPEDMWVDVQPSIVYEDLNRHLSVYGLFFPPDPGSAVSCTIGGMVASNASGIMALKYGTTRDYVLSLTVVLPSGEVMRFGCNALKTSVGYDLVRLVVGSEGTLGVITEATLRVKRLPRVRRLLVAHFRDYENALDSITDIRSEGLEPAAVEFLDRRTVALISEHLGLQVKDDASMIVIEFHGFSDQGVQIEVREAVKIIEKNGCDDHVVTSSESERMAIWRARKGAYPAILRECRSPVTGDVIVPLSKLKETIRYIYDLSERYSVEVAVFGHLGDGNIHANWLSDRSKKDHWERANSANKELVKYAITVGGAASAEHGVGVEKKEFMELQHGPALSYMRALKRLFDPANILNPGIMIDV
ncbi:MAG: FAD-binding oxidoreductase [Aigarchaeota archaeon]|nr:FAD-binding oxidoreductase [Aigarchaeota archaeon]MDW8092897.1 FAD-binding oxidoreductase [Nitrososphaerota archaeon]